MRTALLYRGVSVRGGGGSVQEGLCKEDPRTETPPPPSPGQNDTRE